MCFRILTRRSCPRGFTLLELLVVVAIIVVLLAMLMPALDQAIYQAELAVCGARIKGIATAAVNYSLAARRRYPERTAHSSSPDTRTSVHIAANRFDDRPTFRDMGLPVNMLQCPLITQLDLDAADANIIFGSYTMYFGIQYPAERGMMRLGQRWTWTNDYNRSPALKYKLSVLAGDYDVLYRSSGALAIGSHPDKLGKMWPNIVITQGSGNTFSQWRMAGGYDRGNIDTNFTFEDGSVGRYNDVSYDNADDRMAEVPWDSSNFATGHFMQVPNR